MRRGETDLDPAKRHVEEAEADVARQKRLSCGSSVILPGWLPTLAALDDPERAYDRRTPGLKLTSSFGSILGC